MMERVAASEVVVCIGSNAPDRLSRMAEAVGFLESLLADCRFSVIRDSDDTSGRTDKRYSNRLCVGRFNGCYDELNRQLKNYERQRRRHDRDGEVGIDLDTVLFGGSVMRPGTYSAPYFQYLYSDLV